MRAMASNPSTGCSLLARAVAAYPKLAEYIDQAAYVWTDLAGFRGNLGSLSTRLLQERIDQLASDHISEPQKHFEKCQARLCMSAWDKVNGAHAYREFRNQRGITLQILSEFVSM